MSNEQSVSTQKINEVVTAVMEKVWQAVSGDPIRAWYAGHPGRNRNVPTIWQAVCELVRFVAASPQGYLLDLERRRPTPTPGRVGLFPMLEIVIQRDRYLNMNAADAIGVALRAFAETTFLTGDLHLVVKCDLPHPNTVFMDQHYMCHHGEVRTVVDLLAGTTEITATYSTKGDDACISSLKVQSRLDGQDSHVTTDICDRKGNYWCGCGDNVYKLAMHWVIGTTEGDRFQQHRPHGYLDIGDTSTRIGQLPGDGSTQIVRAISHSIAHHRSGQHTTVICDLPAGEQPDNDRCWLGHGRYLLTEADEQISHTPTATLYSQRPRATPHSYVPGIVFSTLSPAEIAEHSDLPGEPKFTFSTVDAQLVPVTCQANKYCQSTFEFSGTHNAPIVEICTCRRIPTEHVVEENWPQFVVRTKLRFQHPLAELDWSMFAAFQEVSIWTNPTMLTPVMTTAEKYQAECLSHEARLGDVLVERYGLKLSKVYNRLLLIYETFNRATGALESSRTVIPSLGGLVIDHRVRVSLEQTGGLDAMYQKLVQTLDNDDGTSTIHVADGGQCTTVTANLTTGVLHRVATQEVLTVGLADPKNWDWDPNGEPVFDLQLV